MTADRTPRPAPVEIDPSIADQFVDENGKPWNQTMNGSLWAKAFCALNPGHDEELMLAWFCNAIMAGWDHRQWKLDQESCPVPVAVGERLPNCVATELAAAKAKHPLWPTDPLHAVAIVSEEAGELARAVLQVSYEPGKATMADVAKEAIQTAAVALRFIESLDRYIYADGLNMHSQDAIPTPATEEA